MEIESENGFKITLQKGQKRDIGRKELFLGFNSNDQKVSRKQISFSLQKYPNSCVQFEVIGKNPIWVYDKASDEIRVFKRDEKGEMVDGDRFCLSGLKPVWFSVREKESEGYVLDFDLELESVDVSALDPVKEFGFLVIGHEFDHYVKHKISPPTTWDWFLEEPKKESDDEIDGRKRSRSTRRKRKTSDGNDDDDEWTGESEEVKELISKTRKVPRPKYSTRSKDCDKPAKDKERNKSSTQKKIICKDEEEDDDDEEDDTLGGFIVKDNEVKEEEEDEDEDETELDEEEEEDFEEDDDED